MATFIFDGTTNITAAKTDTVVITANPALFTSVSDSAGNSTLNFSGKLLTITGTSFGLNTTAYPNVTLAGGTFSTAAASPTITGANDLVIGPTGTTAISTDGTASSVKAIFGGLGTSDPIDGPDTITLGGKGSFLVYGNAGDDNISNGTAFDSTSFVTTFGGKGTDTIDYLTTANTSAKFAIYGGEGNDTISVANSGSGANTTIFGGQGAADPNDGNDTIRFLGGGTVNIFANAGDDTVTLGGTVAVAGAGGAAGTLDSSTVATIHGGIGTDTISVNVGVTTGTAANAATATGTTKASIVVYGDEGGDTISVTGNAGTTVIYGDTAAADANGGNDTITYAGQGTSTIYAAGGNDTVNLNGIGSANADSTSVSNVFLGNGNDILNVGIGAVSGSTTAGTGTINLTGGAGSDAFNIGSNTNGTTQSAGTGQGITITDFTTGVSGDTLRINNNINDGANAATLGKFVVDGSQAQTLQQALNLAEQANGGTQGTVGIVAFQGSTYVVVHQSATSTTAAFDPTQDLAIKLTGVTDVAAVSSAITVV